MLLTSGLTHAQVLLTQSACVLLAMLKCVQALCLAASPRSQKPRVPFLVKAMRGFVGFEFACSNIFHTA